VFRLRFLRKLKSLSKRQRNILLIVGAASFFNNYDGALLSLAIAQIQRSLHVAESALGPMVAIITLGTVVAPLITSQADRYGRRRLLLITLGFFSLLSGMTAFSWNVASFVGFKFLTVTFAAAEGSIAVVILVEEVNAESRGLAVGLLGVVTKFGYGLAALGFALLPMVPFGWRGLFMVAFIPLLLLVPLWRLLPESNRFERDRGTHRGQSFFTPFRKLVRAYPRRFAMIAVVMFLSAMGGTPAGLFQSKYLQQVHHWSTANVSTLVFAGGAMGVLGDIVAGHLSDHAGRRLIGTAALIGAPLLAALFFNSSGIAMVGAWIGALFCQTAGSTVLNTFSAELFPTSHRSTANSAIAVTATLGGSAALALESWLYKLMGTHWRAVSVLLFATVIAGILLALLFPETASAELETISPEQPVRTHRRHRFEPTRSAS
jgi:MFS family permease